MFAIISSLCLSMLLYADSRFDKNKNKLIFRSYYKKRYMNNFLVYESCVLS